MSDGEVLQFRRAQTADEEMDEALSSLDHAAIDVAQALQTVAEAMWGLISAIEATKIAVAKVSQPPGDAN